MNSKSNLVRGALYTSVSLAALFSMQLVNDQVVGASTEKSGMSTTSADQPTTASIQTSNNILQRSLKISMNMKRT